MPDFDDIIDFPEDFDWEEVEHIHVSRGNEGWEIWFEMSGGDVQEVDEIFSDSEFEDFFWDDLYWWAMDEGIEIDKEVEY